MARATRWTEEKIKTLRLPEGKAEQRVLVEPGLYLYLRQRASGEVAKQWQYRAQVDGVRRWLSLGAFPSVGLAKAGSEMDTHRTAHEAAKKGEGDHPVLTARFARKKARSEPTVAELFDMWVADKRLGSARKQGQPVRERTVTVLTQNFDLDIKGRIGNAKVGKLTREAIQTCIDAPRKRGAPGAAAHVYRTLRGLMNFAVKRGYVLGADPMRGIENPKPYRPAPVNAANDKEVLTLLNAVEASNMWQSTKLAIEFALLTGARPSEVRMATWSEFDIKRRTWLIHADRVKSGSAFRVHLSDAAVKLLDQAKVIPKFRKSPQAEPGGTAPTKRVRSADYVFPGAEGAALEKMAIARALTRLFERSDADTTKKLRPHDLRRTFRTMLSRLGVQPHIAELCMNHQETETMRRVYDGHDYGAETAAAWDLAGSHITSLRSGGAQVISINQKRPAS